VPLSLPSRARVLLALALRVNGSSFFGAWAQGVPFLYGKVFIYLFYRMKIYLLTYMI
jgi:hypothetical protein